jgi:hypothetical protein
MIKMRIVNKILIMISCFLVPSSLVFASPIVKREKGLIVTCPSPKNIGFHYEVLAPEGWTEDHKFGDLIELQHAPITYEEEETGGAKLLEIKCNYKVVNRPDESVDLTVTLPEGYSIPGNCKIQNQVVFCG